MIYYSLPEKHRVNVIIEKRQARADHKDTNEKKTSSQSTKGQRLWPELASNFIIDYHRSHDQAPEFGSEPPHEQHPTWHYLHSMRTVARSNSVTTFWSWEVFSKWVVLVQTCRDIIDQNPAHGDHQLSKDVLRCLLWNSFGYMNIF